MRDYAKVAPQFWTGETGKKLRALGPQAQVLALYLITCPSANMIGLYYLPLPTLCHETGSPSEGALEALRSLSEGGFAHYDEATEHVFVPEMACFQIGEHLSQRDNRHKAILRELESFGKSPFINDFLARYREDFELGSVYPANFSLSPSGAPSKPLRSQKQEQEQEQENNEAPSGKVKVANGSLITMKTFFARCREAGEEPIPETDAVFGYADKAKIPHAFVALAWKVFRAKYHDAQKKYIDWRKAFRNYVEATAYGLWTIDAEGTYVLTGKGKQAEKVHGK